MAWHLSARIGGRPEHREWLRDTSRPFIAPVVAQSAVVQPFVTVDGGCERATSVGERAILLAHSHVGHDALIGDDAEVSTGAVIGGFAEVGEGARIGLNAVVLPYRKVGAGAVVGAGSVVTRDVPAGETWVGNPARWLAPDQRDSRPHSQRGESWHPSGVRLDYDG